VMPTYSSGESFTVQGPPMVWDTAAGTFIVDDERAAAEGWRSELRGTTVAWVKEWPREAGEAQRERDERDAELAKQYGELP